MEVNFNGAPKNKDPNIVCEGVYKGIRYTITKIEVDDDTSEKKFNEKD